MKHSVSHSLGKDMARKVAHAAFESYSNRFAEYSPRTTWKTEDQADIQFSVKGMELKGALAVSETSIDLELKVPFLMKPFQGKALAVIEKEIVKWIEKAKAGELD